MAIGALMGCITAFANWTGDISQAVSYIIVLASGGWLVGYYTGKRSRV